MTGRQLNIRAVGAGYQSFATTVIGRVAAVVPVTAEYDYGIDFYALPRVSLNGQSETAIELCGIQVKGGQQDSLVWGGLDKKGRWKDYELNWFKSLNVPLYVASVDKQFNILSLYSANPALGVFWRTGTPYSIRLLFGEPARDAEYTFAEPSAVSVESRGFGDDMEWTVNLGAPLLHLRLADLEDSSARANATSVLLSWIRNDRTSWSFLQAGVPRHQLPMSYRTNIVPTTTQLWMFWNPTPGAPAVGIEQAVAPVATSMMQHLLGQRDKMGIAAWLPAVDWLAKRGIGDQLVSAACQEARAQLGTT